MIYNPKNQYRCTIIRGKGQTEMEDMLPVYAQMVSDFCPCTKVEFQSRCCNRVSGFLFGNNNFDNLPETNKKTVRNHVTEIAGKLLGLYTLGSDGIVYKTPSCDCLLEYNDFPLFFKNLCSKLQFPNGSQKKRTIEDRILHSVSLKPLCFVVALLDYARKQKCNIILTKQEIGYYVLNCLDVLQGGISVNKVYDQIAKDRKAGVRRDKISGSNAWQHIQEQFNLLELSNVVQMDSKYIWLNDQEEYAISVFLDKNKEGLFDMYSYDYSDKESVSKMYSEWGEYYGLFDERFFHARTVVRRANASSGVKENGAVGLTALELGDEGEMLVYRYECERVRAYKERLVNKVLLLGKTKGLGYDISSIEADENPRKPEFARYIEVKSTKRSTVPSFDSKWLDSINLTSKEWIAAEQYGEYYNIYRVYFTKNKTIIIRIQNPYGLCQKGEIDVYPTIYQMNFDNKVIIKQYEQDV